MAKSLSIPEIGKPSLPRKRSHFYRPKTCSYLRPRKAISMANTPLSLRLAPETYARLREAASAAHTPLATLAAELIRGGLSGELRSHQSDDIHPLVAETLAVFARVEGPDVKARLEGALVLAKVAAAGGAPAVNAVRALNLIFNEIEMLTADDTFGDFLSTPTIASMA